MRQRDHRGSSDDLAGFSAGASGGLPVIVGGRGCDAWCARAAEGGRGAGAGRMEGTGQRREEEGEDRSGGSAVQVQHVGGANGFRRRRGQSSQTATTLPEGGNHHDVVVG